jgi:hypothetical protein
MIEERRHVLERGAQEPGPVHLERAVERRAAAHGRPRRAAGPIDRRSGFTVNIYDSWFQSGASDLDDVNAMGINAGINRQFTNRLVGTIAVGLDALNRKQVEDELIATGQLGLRYNF